MEMVSYPTTSSSKVITIHAGLEQLGPSFKAVMDVYKQEHDEKAKIKYNGILPSTRLHRIHDGSPEPLQRRDVLEDSFFSA